MESQGARLKKIRLQKGLSLEEVSKKTKIHLKILKAIEEDSLIDVSPVYIKGFLKIYCQFLGEQPRDFIPDYREPQSAVKFGLSVQEKPVSTRNLTSFKFDFLDSKIIKFFIYALIFILVSIGLFKLGKAISLKRSLPGRIEKKAPATKAEKKEATAPTIKPVAAETSSQKSVSSGVRLVIQAKENCWISLKLDGHTVFQNILKKGRSENWQAKEKIEFSLSNAGVVDLEINGKLVSNLGRKGQAIKNIVITKEGLTVGGR